MKKTLRNGAIYDTDKGRIVANPGGGTHAITSATAREMVRLREAKRMRLYAEGAQLAVEDMGLIERYGEDAHIVERARNLQVIAGSADAGKAAVMAASHLDRAQGLEVRGGAPQEPPATDRPDVILALIALIDGEGRDVVDADVTDADDGGGGVGG